MNNHLRYTGTTEIEKRVWMAVLACKCSAHQCCANLIPKPYFSDHIVSIFHLANTSTWNRRNVQASAPTTTFRRQSIWLRSYRTCISWVRPPLFCFTTKFLWVLMTLLDDRCNFQGVPWTSLNGETAKKSEPFSSSVTSFTTLQELLSRNANNTN